MADGILGDVVSRLQGRSASGAIPGDSYWAPDYDTRLAAEDWTRDYSDDLETPIGLSSGPATKLSGASSTRALGLPRPAIPGYGSVADLAAQALHFNRSLAQVTADWHCPELYYRKHGEFRANPHTPLLWTQANLQLALIALQSSPVRR